ncbi:MAG: porin family protein [Acidiferrobacterales bacterium]
MKMKQWVSITIVVFVSASMVPFASATDRRGYAGIGIGNADLDRGGFDDDTGFKIFGGYQFNKNFAVEGAYIDLGDFKSPTQLISVDGFQAAASGIIPLAKQFRVFGKAGLFRNGGTDLTYGLGFEWERKIGVRAEWERFDDVFGSSRVDMVSVSAVFSFGTRGESK